MNYISILSISLLLVDLLVEKGKLSLILVIYIFSVNLINWSVSESDNLWVRLTPIGLLVGPVIAGLFFSGFLILLCTTNSFTQLPRWSEKCSNDFLEINDFIDKNHGLPVYWGGL